MGLPVNLNSGNAGKYYHSIPAMILYPSLFAPAILTKEDDLEILLLVRSAQTLTEHNIAYQLRIDDKFSSEKIVCSEPLPIECIHIESEQTSLSSEFLETKNGKFKGILDSRIKDIFSSDMAANIASESIKDFFTSGYFTKIYHIRITNKNLFKSQTKNPRRGIYSLIWVHVPHIMNLDFLDKKGRKSTSDGFDLATITYMQLNILDTLSYSKPILIPTDIESKLIQATLDEIFKKNHPDVDKSQLPWWKYGFINGIPCVKNFDGNHPIQSYHPVFYFEDLNYANIAHIADIHISARQHVMRKSKARVIEANVDSTDHKISSEIGPMINCNLENLNKMLDQIGTDSGVHIVAISGDLIDYLQSLIINDLGKYMSPDEIRKNIAASKNEFKKNHKFGVDFIALYSILLNFYRKYKKPILIVNGNHDAYCEPYGIAPRVLTKGKLKRANEGIPADHNLTTYEALLMFGDTYLEHNETFNKDQWIWYSIILSPFSNFVVQLPKQLIIGLGWGNNEDVLGIYNDTGQDFWGHLPRSDNAISDNQKKLVEKSLATKGNRKTILMTHFTFISYRDFIPMVPQHEGKIFLEIKDDIMDFGSYDWGTFETNRSLFYAKHLADNKDIQCVLCGHSHRRGIYKIIGKDFNSIKTHFYEFDDFQKKFNLDDRNKSPIIIVSDSAGPLPRYNYEGEFSGWGSYNPSWTKIEYNDSGFIKNITFEICKTKNSQPRFIVAVDYLDLIKGFDVIKQFSYALNPYREENYASYNFRLDLHSELNKYVCVKKIFLYSFLCNKWQRLEMVHIYDGGEERWQIQNPKLFRTSFCNPDSKLFAAFKFDPTPNKSKLLKQYDFSSYWCFPVNIDDRRVHGMKVYDIIRNKEKAEYPDQDWYKDNFF